MVPVIGKGLPAACLFLRTGPHTFRGMRTADQAAAVGQGAEDINVPETDFASAPRITGNSRQGLIIEKQT